MHTSIAVCLTSLTLACATSAQAAVRWSGERLDGGAMVFRAQDLATGQIEQLVLHQSELRLDRPVMITLDADIDSGRQGMGLVWTDHTNTVHAARLDLPGAVDATFDPDKARFRADPEQVTPARTTLDAVDAMARVEVTVQGAVGELFDVLQTNRQQADPETGVPGDVDGDGTVLIHDLLDVVSAFAEVCLPEDDCVGDVTGDMHVNVHDLLAVLMHLGETNANEQVGPARLLHFQLVGGSHDLSDPNRIHPNIYNDEEGWHALIENNLEDIAAQIPDGWDLWLHNPGGYWYDHDFTWRVPEGETQPMIFEQMQFARDHRPGLLELDAVRSWMNDRDGLMYGYVGLPLSFDSPTNDWPTTDTHGAPDMVHTWYGDLLQQGFRGVGHDASSHHPDDSSWITAMVPELRARGVEVFLESIPKRGNHHLLGQSVVAEHRLWQAFAEQQPYTFYTEAEITAAGGRAIHLVTWPQGMHPSDPGYDPNFNVHQWQLDTAEALLEAGKTVAVNLAGLARHGYDITPLIAVSQ